MNYLPCATSLLLAILLAASCRKSSPDSAEDTPPADRGQPRGTALAPVAAPTGSFATHLARSGPAPQEWKPIEPPAGVSRVEFASGGLKLFAWFAKPTHATHGATPVIVYMHGGFAFDETDFEVCRPALQRGFALLTPTTRGENGNPGSFELMLGEVDDALAAVQWVAGQPGIDRGRIFMFGHSNGGGIAALASLRPNGLIRAAGSVGGMYTSATFRAWKVNGWVPFDPGDAEEVGARVFLPRLAELRVLHVAYIATGDGWTTVDVTKLEGTAKQKGVPFQPVLVEGSHHSIIRQALEDFLDRVGG